MKELTLKSPIAPREGGGLSWDQFPSRAEIDDRIVRARLERSLEVKRLAQAMCRLVRAFRAEAGAER